MLSRSPRKRRRSLSGLSRRNSATVSGDNTPLFSSHAKSATASEGAVGSNSETIFTSSSGETSDCRSYRQVCLKALYRGEQPHFHECMKQRSRFSETPGDVHRCSACFDRRNQSPVSHRQTPLRKKEDRRLLFRHPAVERCRDDSKRSVTR